MNIVGILAIISPVGIAFAIYVYFANKRIKNKLSEDEELKNSKKGAFLDSFRAGLIIEVFLLFLKNKCNLCSCCHPYRAFMDTIL